jgi:IS30 family transposase
MAPRSSSEGVPGRSTSSAAEFVSAELAADWSPEQIAGCLAKHHPPGSDWRVSHETIYRSLFIQSHGVLAKQPQNTFDRAGRSAAASTTR